MNWIRDFSISGGVVPPVRNIDNDAPRPLRQAFVDLVFHLVEESQGIIDPTHMYRLISQSLGIPPSGQPYSGPRYASGRDIQRVEWPMVYDLICRLWPEFNRTGLQELYREGVNRILSTSGVVWDLDQNGHLRSVLPPAAQNQVDAAIAELGASHFGPALALFDAARDAYDDRPRRDRDACANVFDAMESVAKIIYQLPNATFGDVLDRARRIGALQNHTIRVLQSIYTLANNTFRHGMAADFNLSAAEVDFVYLSCIGGILLFARSVPSADQR